MLFNAKTANRMKKYIVNITLAALLTFAMHGTAFGQFERQDSPPGPPGHDEDTDQPAPIGGGIAILLALGAGYGAKKVYDARKKLSE